MTSRHRVGIVRFPGTNCDLDTWEALSLVPGLEPLWLSHKEKNAGDLEAIILPGGFSYGDYLRTGAIAARAPVMDLVGDFAEKGHPVLGICNGFQILAEAGILPGTLLPNRGRTFLCQDESLVMENCRTPFTAFFDPGTPITLPIAHQEGRFFIDSDQLQEIEKKGQVLLRYQKNPNGSLREIAGLANERGNVVGLMPHPERRAFSLFGKNDGLLFFRSLALALDRQSLPTSSPVH
ncbi:MAG: phosphoribosylformylglycinamidine synthase subunit PurQ [Nitrospirae bacterium]|nr:MAG: Phosphoribosylformylglycinamidine synthase 1 [Leptospirillum sp. Group IV 'UBA BS']MCL4485320.1 phosphoribosylformylglycinamidine synthase subunit PurQ [Nitrospirota bacterium]MCL5285064.1 phosphoribosylformylglycinamidine synthase subunit PurQ [Nitrospirota bacterium]